jgi:hypothetical protein
MSMQQRPTPEQLSRDRQITTPGIILVEGRTGEMFLRELIEKELKLQAQVEARTFGEKEASNLTLFLNAFATKSELRQRVERLGIIRDAESEGGAKAFGNVVGGLQAFNRQNPSFALPVPDQLNSITNAAGARPQVSVFVLPDCGKPGMLETLCLDAVDEIEQNAQPQTRLLPCVNEFFGCLDSRGRKPKNPTKARFAGFALAVDVIDPQLGRAAQKGAIPWQAKAFDSLKEFVRSIAGP